MKKDKEYLQSVIQRRIDNLPSMYEGLYIEGSRDAYDLVLQDIDELDEPEVTHEQVVEWIENNEFYCHATAETVLENAVDKGELGYYGTKYSVVEKPVIPKYVADWIEDIKLNNSLRVAFEYIAQLKVDYHDNPLAFWVEEGNSETFAKAWICGYEVENEPKYHALIRGYELVSGYDIYWNYDKFDDSLFVSRLYPVHDNFITEMSKSEWNELGINETNADFVKVEENE